MTRSVADSADEALKAKGLMVADYLHDGYEEEPWDESAWPPVPEELFDPDYDEAP